MLEAAAGFPSELLEGSEEDDGSALADVLAGVAVAGFLRESVT
ncbi:MAG: hypothetical protein ACRD0K_05475 [Egibacteraceae bacterium]